jgi:hypothetical protein
MAECGNVNSGHSRSFQHGHAFRDFLDRAIQRNRCHGQAFFTAPNLQLSKQIPHLMQAG